MKRSRAALMVLIVALGCEGEGTGPQLPPGQQATISGYDLVNVSLTVGLTDRVTRSVECPGGRYVLGGGAYPRTIGLTAVGDRAVTIMGSGPTDDQHGWRVDAMIHSQGVVLEIYAICAHVQF